MAGRRIEFDPTARRAQAAQDSHQPQPQGAQIIPLRPDFHPAFAGYGDGQLRARVACLASLLSDEDLALLTHWLAWRGIR